MNYTDVRLTFYEKTGTNAASMPDATLNLYTQRAEERINSLAMISDGRWQQDDYNYTDLPIGTKTLVNGQQDYSLASSQLRVSGVSVKTAGGIWRALLPFDPADLGTSSSPLSFIPLVAFGPTMDRAEFLKTPALPQYYDKQGGSVILYPAPDNGVSVTLAAGLKIYYERGPLLFDFSLATFTDGTGSLSSTPGFNSNFHELIPLLASYKYCIVNKPALLQGLLNEITLLEKGFVAANSTRDFDERKIMSGRKIKFI